MSTHENRVAILGISAFYHDSAAALVVDGEIVAAAQEERFTRRKFDPSFPAHAAAYALAEAGIDIEDLAAVVFYDKPYRKFGRILATSAAFAPAGRAAFADAMQEWLGGKLFARRRIRKALRALAGRPLRRMPPILFSEHHLSHAASAFYPSPFASAAILTIDGVGEWATTTIGRGAGSEITILKEMRFPHSLGLLYAAVTYYCGFKVNSGEYKLMGLAPYGEHGSARVESYKRLILEKLADLKQDGSLFLDMRYFDFGAGGSMTNDAAWEGLFGIPRRTTEGPLPDEYMDLALAIQEVTDEAVVRLAKTAQEATGERALVMAGGVALNCVANRRLLESGVFDDIWIQPAAGDAGGALGAALAAHHLFFGAPRETPRQPDAMRGSFLGPSYSDAEAEAMLRPEGAVHTALADEELMDRVAGLLADGRIIGWFQGRMEWGPRALGARSILADPRNPEMQQKLNLKIKFREGFRPFAPSVLESDAQEYFETDRPSPYMLFTAPVREERRKPLAPRDAGSLARINAPRSDVPSITHLDYSARLQTVSPEANPRFAALLGAFKRQTGYGMLVNTSFNVRGEPIVMTPADAYRCFMDTDIDYLVIGNLLFDKRAQPAGAREGAPRAYAED